MSNLPLRDITGHCHGECRDLVRDADEKRQSEISSQPYTPSEPSVNVPWANSRSEAPGFFGGHV